MISARSAQSTTRSPRITQGVRLAAIALLVFLLSLCGALPALADDDNSGLAVGGSMQLDATSLSAAAESSVSLQATIAVDQASARELLGLVNSARSAAGVSALSWDTDLEQTAIQRAVETAIRWTHDRPNNTKCFTAWPSRLSSYRGENIARGQTSSSMVNDLWTDSEGHYANMVNARFTAMAAGCAVNEYGTRYWVECFAVGSPNGMSGTPVTGYVTRTVSVLPSLVSFNVDGDDQLFVSKSASFKATAGEADISSSVRWSTSDASLASVTSGGVLTALKPGTVVLNADIGSSGASVSKTVTLLERNLTNAHIDYSGSHYDWYDWRVDDYVHAVPFSNALTFPSTTVTLDGETLTEGVDYTLTYAIDHEARKGIITAYGKGEYVGSSKSISFDIIPVSINDTTIAGLGDRAYTGKAINTGVKLSYYGYDNIREGVDYKVTFANNLKVGTASVAITGMGLVEGTRTATFKIVKAKNPMKVTAKTAAVKFKKKAQKIARPLKVTGAKGAVTYAKAGGSKYLKVSKATGNIVVAKKTPAGTYKVSIAVKASGDSGYKARKITKRVSVVVQKATNNLKVEVSPRSVKYSKVKKKARSVAPITVARAKGKVTFAKKSGSSRLTVNETTGKVKVKKGTKRGTYSMKVKVRAKGGKNYKARSKTVTVKVRVK